MRGYDRPGHQFHIVTNSSDKFFPYMSQISFLNHMKILSVMQVNNMKILSVIQVNKLHELLFCSRRKLSDLVVIK